MIPAVLGITGACGAAWSSTSCRTRGVNTLGLHVPARKGLTLLPISQKLIQILQMAIYWPSHHSARYLELFKQLAYDTAASFTI